MNNNTTAVDREKAETTFNPMSEYKIGHTLYTVTTVVLLTNHIKNQPETVSN